ncbi:TRAP transporter small permease [Syntrophomonas erecta]
MEKIEKIEQVVLRIEEILVTILALVMTVVIFSQVFSRTLMHYSLPWSEELGRYLFIWVSFLGASVALVRGAHLGIDVLLRKFPPRMKTIVMIATNLLLLVLFGIIFAQGNHLVTATALQKSAALQMPMSWAYLALPLSAALMIFHTLVMLVKEISQLISKGGVEA